MYPRLTSFAFNPIHSLWIHFYETLIFKIVHGFFSTFLVCSFWLVWRFYFPFCLFSLPQSHSFHLWQWEQVSFFFLTMGMTSWRLLGKRACSLNEDVPRAYVFCHYANLHSGFADWMTSRAICPSGNSQIDVSEIVRVIWVISWDFEILCDICRNSSLEPPILPNWRWIIYCHWRDSINSTSCLFWSEEYFSFHLAKDISAKRFKLMETLKKKKWNSIFLLRFNLAKCLLLLWLLLLFFVKKNMDSLVFVIDKFSFH